MPGGLDLLPGAQVVLPTTNGTVKHTVALTPGGELKHVNVLALKCGEAYASVRATVAGQLRLSATVKGVAVKGAKASPNGGGALAAPSASSYMYTSSSASSFASTWTAGSATLGVEAAAAEVFDIVPLDQSLGGLRVMVHARDAYGNLDEKCEREVVLELDGNDGFDGADGVMVKLSRGTAELTGIRPKSE